MSCGCDKQRTRNVERLWKQVDSLRTENARLQERVETSETNWAAVTEAERVTHREWDRTLDELDGYKALAKGCKEALEEALKWRDEHDSYMLPGPWFFTARAAIAKEAP